MDTLQPIIAERRTYTDVGYSHDHPFAQLIVPLTGALFIETQVHQFELDESSVFFVPPGCRHYFYARDTNEFLVLDIPAHLIIGVVDETSSEGIRAEFGDRWQAIRTLLLSELDDQVSTNSASLTSQSTALLHLVHYISSLLAQSRCSRSLHYIHQHYHRPLNVAQLAQIEGYSLSYYSGWFKVQTGQSPTAYIQNLRIERAKDLLRHTDIPIYQIAQQVGFERASSLTRLFQQCERITPQRYRIKNQNLANSLLKSG